MLEKSFRGNYVPAFALGMENPPGNRTSGVITKREFPGYISISIGIILIHHNGTGFGGKYAPFGFFEKASPAGLGFD
jgi:hypothetical protein